MPLSLIESHLKEVIASRLTPRESQTIGIEVEHFLYTPNLQRIPVNPGGAFSSTDFLVELRARGNHGELSLEPGGQIEYSSRPYRSLHELRAEWEAHFAALLEVCRARGLATLDLAVEPFADPDEIAIIDSLKYHLMHERFARTGTLGRWMMKNTTSVQVNLDYTSLEEAARLAFVADCLQPFFSLLFANTPLMHGRMVERENLRLKIWEDTDPVRCGSLLGHGIERPDDLIDRFVRITAAAPTIFTLSPDGAYGAFDGTLGEWLSTVGRERELPLADGMAALHQMFTHVRFKDVLELRAFDRPPFGHELAPVALAAALLRAPAVFPDLEATVERWPPKKRMEVNGRSLTLDLGQEAIEGKSFRWWLELLLEMAEQGFRERAEELKIATERDFLFPFARTVLADGPKGLADQKAIRARIMEWRGEAPPQERVRDLLRQRARAIELEIG